MTATLTFDLNDHDERQAHMRCVKALDMAIALWEIHTRLRSECEKVIDRVDKNQQYAFSEGVELAIREMRDIILAHNINLDELVS